MVVPDLLLMVLESAVNLREETQESLPLGVKPAKVARAPLALSLSELSLRLTRTCSGGTVCALMPPRLHLPTAVPPLRPLSRPQPLLRVVALA